MPVILSILVDGIRGKLLLTARLQRHGVRPGTPKTSPLSELQIQAPRPSISGGMAFRSSELMHSNNTGAEFAIGNVTVLFAPIIDVCTDIDTFATDRQNRCLCLSRWS